MPRIALVSTSDTDLLSARASGADYVYVNPSKAAHTEMADGVRGRRPDRRPDARLAEEPVHAASTGSARTGKPMVVLGGEQTPDAALMELSTVPIGVAADAHVYLAQGGPAEPAPAARVPLRHGAADRRRVRAAGRAAGLGCCPRALSSSSVAQSPRVGILFYRAQYTAGNTAYVEALADAIDAAGGVGVPIFATSLRDAPADLLDYLGTLDALVTTVLAAGGTRPATASAGRGRRSLGRTRPRRLGHPDPAGPLPDLGPRVVGGFRRGDDPARRGHPGGGTGVRRPDHHGAVLVQGDRRRRAAGTTFPIMNVAGGSPRSRSTTPGCGTSRPRTARSRSCSRRIRPSTPGSATRSGWTPRSR